MSAEETGKVPSALARSKGEGLSELARRIVTLMIGSEISEGHLDNAAARVERLLRPGLEAALAALRAARSEGAK